MKGKSIINIWLISLLLSGSGIAMAANKENSQATLKSTQLEKQYSVFFAQGVKHYQKGNYEEALEMLLKAEKGDSENAQVYYYLGMTYQGKGKYLEAEKFLAKSAELDASQGNTYAHLGEVLYRLGRYDDAKLALEEAEAKTKLSAYIQYLKGLTLMELEDYAGAIKALNKTMVYDMAYQQNAIYALGLVYKKQGNKTAAENSFKAAVAIDSESKTGVFSSIGLQSLHNEEQRPLHIDLSYGFHYDDNVLLKPAAISPSFFPRGQSDFVHEFVMHAKYKPETRGSLSFYGDASYYKSIHQKLTQVDVDGFGISLAPSLNTSLGSFTIEGKGDYYLVGHNRYLNILSINPSFGFSLGKANYGILHVGYQHKKFFETIASIDENRNGTNWSAGYSHYIYTEDQSANLLIAYTLDRDNTRGNNWDYLGSKWSIAGLYPFNDNFGFRFNGSYYYQNYKYVHSQFGVARKDRIFSVGSMLVYNVDWGALLFQYTFVSEKSNISVYSYKRKVSGVSFEYTY